MNQHSSKEDNRIQGPYKVSTTISSIQSKTAKYGKKKKQENLTDKEKKAVNKK